MQKSKRPDEGVEPSWENVHRDPISTIDAWPAHTEPAHAGEGMKTPVPGRAVHLSALEETAIVLRSFQLSPDTIFLREERIRL